MNIGPLALPIEPLMLLVGFGASLVVCRLFRETKDKTESAIFTSTLIGLLIARIAFVLEYLPSYRGSFVKMIDFRDAGFDALPGMAVGIAVVLVLIIRRASIRRPLAVAASVGLIVWGAAGVTAKRLSHPASVPSLSLPDEAGAPRSLEQHDGKPLIINLWATWCGPCRSEMPILAAEQRRRSELDLVFVNQGESRLAVSAFMADLGLHIGNSRLDPDLMLAKATGTTAYPTTLFYDASGRLLEKHLGRFSEATFEATLARLYPSLVPPR
jgi:thiol-disulfide isomerase/thioredoxin